ncbi:hypothetical protein L1987_74759 [Smallanthus sonchifolius]|uniref:Uncharacterized protein n=1 Tax=Smallanthus sonchifolius TaxID=185202 RepID=A0ACB9A487_9ASTR|nr:hypothetical protein L1987_74759 [Smallanthus sonchifolius]
MKKHFYQRISQFRSSFQTPNSIQQHTHFRLIRGLCSTPSNRVSEIVNEMMNLTLLESADLTEVMRKKMGINEMPIMAVMMPGMGLKTGVRGGGGGVKGGEEKTTEKTAFDLKLEGGFDGGSKIKIIKEVRTFTDLGLKEAKELVEKAPTLLKKGVPKEEAEKIIEKMKAIGAKVACQRYKFLYALSSSNIGEIMSDFVNGIRTFFFFFFCRSVYSNLYAREKHHILNNFLPGKTILIDLLKLGFIVNLLFVT